MGTVFSVSEFLSELPISTRQHLIECCYKSDTVFLVRTLDHCCSDNIDLRRAMMNGDNFISNSDLHRVACRIINKTYHEKVLKEHPDKGGNASSFRSVQEAWQILRGDSVVLTPDISTIDQVKMALHVLGITSGELRYQQFIYIKEKVRNTTPTTLILDTKPAAKENRRPAKENRPPLEHDLFCKKKHTAASPAMIRRRSARLAAKNV
jgi:hypothetical protein